MEYFKLISTQIRLEFPEVEFTEIDENRWETRKVGVFSGARYGYAQLDKDQVIEIGDVGLSDKPWHSELDHERWLRSNPQFQEAKISNAEFEIVWQKAQDYWKGR